MTLFRKSHGSQGRSAAAVLAMAGAAVIGLSPLPAAAVTIGAEVEVDAECVRTCLSELRGCLKETREAFAECALEGGCLELAATMRLTCQADATASVCLEARADYQDCIAPCRAELRNDTKICRNEGLACLHDECELSDLPEQCGRVRASTSAN